MIQHASCVAVAGQGVLIRGASGSGKSSLALQLIALGATLVADDRVCLSRVGTSIEARPWPRLAGLIEARGIGLLRLRSLPSVRLSLVVDLDTAEASRIPPARSCDILQQPVPLIRQVPGNHFPAMVLVTATAQIHPPDKIPE